MGKLPKALLCLLFMLSVVMAIFNPYVQQRALAAKPLIANSDGQCQQGGEWHGMPYECGYFSRDLTLDLHGMNQDTASGTQAVTSVQAYEDWISCQYNGDSNAGLPDSFCDQNNDWTRVVQARVVADYYISELLNDKNFNDGSISANADSDSNPASPNWHTLNGLDLPAPEIADFKNRLADYQNINASFPNPNGPGAESSGSNGYILWDTNYYDPNCAGTNWLPDSSFSGDQYYDNRPNNPAYGSIHDDVSSNIKNSPACGFNYNDVMQIWTYNTPGNPASGQTLTFMMYVFCGNDLTNGPNGGLAPAINEYHLKPTVTATSSAYVEPGTPNPITFQAAIGNYGCSGAGGCTAASAGSFSCVNANYYTIPGYYNGGALPPGTPVGSLNCNVDVPQGGGPPGGTATPVGTIDVSNPGNLGSLDRTVCAQFTVNNSDLSRGGTVPSGSQTSQLTCVYVVQKPYFKVYNGDISAGDGLNCSSNSNAIIESWNANVGTNGAGTQYAAYAASVIDQFASAQNNHNAVTPKGLSFANTSGTYGGNLGTALSCNQDYYAKLPAGTSSLPAGNIPSGTYTLNGTGPAGATIGSGGTFILAAGQQTTIYVNGNLNIDENIEYPASFSLSQLPSFKVIVSGNIYIANNVTQLDGTYVAQANATANTGTIYTCGTNTDTSTQFTNGTWLEGNCTNPLTVNGSFVANAVDLLRVHNSLYQSGGDSAAQQDGGSEDSTGNGTSAAEVFNYNSATWLQPPTASANNNYNTITSLPPVL